MLFNSIIFLIIFLPTFLILWHKIPNVKVKLSILTVFSFVFYGYWDYRFVGLMVLSIIIDYLCGEQIAKHLNTEKSNAKRWMYVSVFANLIILGFFKYFNFFVDSLYSVFPLEEIVSKPTMEIILPVGISFYTFQSMSYSIDLYRGQAKKVKSFLHFSAYVSMFPQLIAGPIVRYSDVSEQIANVKHKLNSKQFMEGIQYFTIGLFRKLFIADFFATYAELFFNGTYEFQFIGAWLGILAYAFQIYFDFSAYSEMAIGLGKMFGFDFPINFNSPYKAKSFSDFWLRWHITLSRFLRDYLYIPLGGNKKGKARTYINLSLTMLIGGLWHGASWMFVIWGALHGAYLSIERLISRERLSRIRIYKYFVFFFVCIAWIFFRADSMDFAVKTLRSALLLEGIESFDSANYSILGVSVPSFVRTYGGMKLLIGVFFVYLMTQYVPNASKIKFRNKTWYVILLALVLFYCLLHVYKPSPFLYFKF
ncbi:MAG: MBOAT family protein [Crocinitomicaceae bacterium]|nr:MBOAT family protein [Crocinitomicaceae bacterium]